MSEVVGSLAIELVLDRSKYDRQLKALRNERGGVVQLAAALDTRALRRQIENISRANSTINFNAKIGNLNALEGQLKTFTRERTISVGVRIDERLVNQRLQALTSSRVVRLQAALINATAIENQIATLTRDRAIRIGVEIDNSSVTQAFKQLTRTKLANGFQIPITFQADAASISSLRSQIGTVVVPVQFQYSEIKPGVTKQEVKVGESGLRELEGGITKSVQNGFKKAQGKGLLGSLGDAITSPIRNIARGFQEGIGITYSQKLTSGVIRNLERELGTSLNRIGEKVGEKFTKVGKLAGDRTLRKLGIEEGLEGLPPKLQEIQKFFNEIIDEKTLNRKFSVLETQVGKLVDDLLTLKGVSTQIGNIGAIGRSLGDITLTPVEGVKERRKQILKQSYDRAQARAAEIQAQKFDSPESIVFGIGGFAGTRGKSSPAVAERIQLLTGEKNPVIPISNTASDLPYNVGEGKLKFFGGAIGTLVSNAVKGYNADAIEAAAQAIAAQKANPNAKINFAGYSQGGFIAQEAVEILNQGGIKSRGVGIGTPRFGLNSTTSKDQFQAILGEGDPLLKLSKLFGMSDYRSFSEGGKAHRLSAYLGTQDTQQGILKQLGIKRLLSPEMQTRVPFEFADFEEELGNLANDVGGVLADPKQAAFFKKTGLYQAQLANVAKHRAKIAEFIDQAVGSDIERLEAYDEALAEVETVIKQSYGVRSEVKPAIKAQNRPPEAAIPKSTIAADSKPLIDSLPDLKQSEPIKLSSNIKDQLGGYNVEVLKEISRVAGLQTSGNKAVLTDRLLAADSSDIENAIRAVTPLIERGVKGGQKLKKVDQTDSEKRLLQFTKDAEKRVNDALRLLQTAEGKRRQDIIDAALNEIEQTSQVLDRITTGKVVAAETRASAGRQKGRLSGLKNQFVKPIDDVELARINPVKGLIQNKALLEDLAVNTVGFAASQVGNQLGVVPGLAGDLGGALVARQALNVGKAGIGAYRGLKDSPQFQQAKKLEQAKLLARQTKLNLQSQAMRQMLGDNLTGDVAGFAIGNGFANAANAGLDALSGAVPGAGLLRAIPFKGAFAAALTVPKIVKARQKFAGADDIQLAKAGEDADTPILQYLEQVDRYVGATFNALEKRKGSDRKKLEKQLKQYIEEQLAYTEQFTNGQFSPQISSQAISTRDAIRKTGTKVGVENSSGRKPIADPKGLSSAIDEAKAVEAKRKAQNQIKLNMQQTYQLLVREAAKLSGISINPRDIPRLTVDDAKLKQIGARALYSIKNNQIIISKEVADLMNGTLGNLEKNQKLLADIIHEARHSFQFDFGRSTIAKQSLGVSKPGVPLIDLANVPRDVQYNAARSAQIANQQAGGLLPKSFQRTIARTEADAYAFEKFSPKIVGSAIEQLRSGTAPKAIDPNAPNEKLVDFFRGVFKFARSPVETTKGAVGGLVDRIKAALLSGLSSQSAKAQDRSGLSGLLANIPVPDGIRKLATVFRASSNASESFRERLRGIRDEIDTAIPGAGKLLGNVKGLAAGFLGFTAISMIVPMMQQFATQSLQAAIALERVKTSLNFSTGNSGKALGFVGKEADRLGLSLQAAQDGYAQLAGATRGTSVQGAATDQLFSGVGAASTTLGLTGEQQGRIFNALSQTASKGKLSAEELRGQIGDAGLVGSFGTAARSLGISESELNKRLEQGAVTAEEFLPKFGRQLQIEYGASAESASGGTQASLNKLQNSTLKAQQNLGGMFTPAVSTGAKVLAGLLDVVANNLDKIAIAAGVFGAVFLAPMAKAILTIGLVQKGLGLAAAGAGAVAKSFGSLLIQFVAVSAAMEAFRSFGEIFALDEVGQGFKNLGDQGEASMNRIAEAARKAAGIVDKTSKPKSSTSKGFDFSLGALKAFGLEDAGISLKSDDLIKAARSNALVTGLTGGIDLSGLTTIEELQQQRRDIEAADQSLITNGLVNQVFSGKISARDKEGRLGTADISDSLKQASEIDKQISARQNERTRLAAQPRTDKKAIADADAEIKRLNEERSRVTAPVIELQAGIQGQIAGARKQLEQKGLTGEERQNLEREIESLEGAQTTLNKLQNDFGTPADRVKDFRQALTELNIELEEVQRRAEINFNIGSRDDLRGRIATAFTDENASLNAGVVNAKRQQQRSEEQLQGTRNALDGAKSKLDAPAAQERLGAIVDTNTGKAISVDSSIAELEKAKQGKDDLTKEDIDRLIAYKKALADLPNQERQVEADRYAVLEAGWQKRLGLIEKEAAKRDLSNRKSVNTAQIRLIEKQKTKSISEEDAAIESAKISGKQVGLELDSAQKQLQDLNAAFNAQQISREQFEQKRLELEGKISDLTVRKAQEELNLREAINRKILEGFERRNRIANAKIDASASDRIFNIRQTQLNGGIVGQGGQTEIAKIELDAAQQRTALKQQELAEVKNLRDKRVLSEKEAADRTLAIEQELRDARSKILDIQIQQRINAIQAETDARKRAIDTQVLDLERLKAADDLANAGLERRKGLLEAQSKLSQATSDLRQSSLKIGIDRASEAGDLQKQLRDGNLGTNSARVARNQLGELGFASGNELQTLAAKQALEAEADAERLAALQQQQLLERESLKLQFELEKIAARRALNEAKIAENKALQNAIDAQSELQKAKITGDANQIANAQNALTAAQQGIDLAKQGVSIAQENNSALQDRLKLEQQISDAKQQQVLNETDAQNAANRRERERSFATLQDQLGNGAVGSSLSSGSLSGGMSGGGSSGGGGSRGFGLVGSDITAYDRGSGAIKKAISDNAYRGAAGQREAVLSALQMSSGREKEFAMAFASQSGYADIVNSLNKIENAQKGAEPSVSRSIDSAIMSASFSGNVVEAIQSLGDRIDKLANRPSNVSISTPTPVDDYADFMNRRAGSMLGNS